MGHLTAQQFVLELNCVSKTFGAGPGLVSALRGVSLAVSEGEFIIVMGPSGSGKSTLLHLMAGLDEPSKGSVLFLGEHLSRLGERERACLRRRKIGFIFQFFNLLPMLTAEENVALPLLLDGRDRQVARHRARQALEGVGLKGKGSRMPAELSGGEKQRVAIARALVIEPVLVLADEPTGNLDRCNSRQVVDLLRGINSRHQCSVVLVTHDEKVVAQADRVIFLEDGQIGTSPRAGERWGEKNARIHDAGPKAGRSAVAR